jgi:hypothetical protein
MSVREHSVKRESSPEGRYIAREIGSSSANAGDRRVTKAVTAGPHFTNFSIVPDTVPQKLRHACFRGRGAHAWSTPNP